ncbi:RICIN domain-containing protein [Streptomyces sp. NPDC058964]|uniref:RICIN domain-containing protein n=1 Tax=Streptomyces sp. NPDC058964 TaxID=3346681 RepID=UPI0036C3B46B
MVLATVLAISFEHGGGADPVSSTTASAAHGMSPRARSQAPPVGAIGPQRTRLRNAAAGLCLDIRGEPKAGAPAQLISCSSSLTQEWSYEADGLLRSGADPGLCLDSHADVGVAVLGTCADQQTRRGNDVRYGLTVRGELLPRWQEQVALTPTTPDPGADIVVKVRDRSADQRWLTDSPSAHHAPS